MLMTESLIDAIEYPPNFTIFVWFYRKNQGAKEVPMNPGKNGTFTSLKLYKNGKLGCCSTPSC